MDALQEQLEQLLAKWHDDQAHYPEESFGAPWAAAAVRLCAQELRAVLDKTKDEAQLV